jgi:hypothetical protein
LLGSFDPTDPYNTGWDLMHGIGVTNSITGPLYDPANKILWDLPHGPSSFEVTDNVIEVAVSHLGSMGILVGTAQNAVIRNNTVTADLGIGCGECGWYGNGSVSIENNLINGRNAGLHLGNPKGTSKAVVDFSTYPPGTMIVPHPGDLSMNISGNMVNMDGSSAIGALHSPTAGIYCWDASMIALFVLGDPFINLKDATVQDNVFTGNADLGVFMDDFFGFTNNGSENNFVNNDWKNLTTNAISVYLGPSTHDNAFGPNKYPPGGAYHEVVDEGTNNRVVGLPANSVTDPGIGQLIRSSVSEAQNNAANVPEMGKSSVWVGSIKLPEKVR